VPDGGIAELAAGFIHEIKNHLGTLSLNLQLLAEDFEGAQSPRERKALERVSRLSGECKKLLEPVERLPAVRPAAASCTPGRRRWTTWSADDRLPRPDRRQRGVEIKWFAAPDLPAVRLDSDLFEQALLNLMLNAEQAMPDGGTLMTPPRESECVKTGARRAVLDSLTRTLWT
jgi:signal transduction histidine kinase